MKNIWIEDNLFGTDAPTLKLSNSVRQLDFMSIAFFIGPIFLQTIPIPVPSQRVLILYFCFFSKIIRHIMDMIKTYIIKIQSRNLIHNNRLLAMIPKNKDPWQDHPLKNDPRSGSNFLSLNRDRDRLQKYWANDQIFWAWTGIEIVCRKYWANAT